MFGALVTGFIQMSLMVSAWKLHETSYAATKDQGIALLTAIGFLLLCLGVHLPPSGTRLADNRLLALPVIYAARGLVAIYMSVMANAGLIIGSGSAATGNGPGFVELASLLWMKQDLTAISATMNSLIWVVLFDVIVILLELRRRAVDTAPPRVIRP